MPIIVDKKSGIKKDTHKYWIRIHTKWIKEEFNQDDKIRDWVKEQSDDQDWFFVREKPEDKEEEHYHIYFRSTKLKKESYRRRIKTILNTTGTGKYSIVHAEENGEIGLLGYCQKDNPELLQKGTGISDEVCLAALNDFREKNPNDPDLIKKKKKTSKPPIWEQYMKENNEWLENNYDEDDVEMIQKLSDHYFDWNIERKKVIKFHQIRDNVITIICNLSPYHRKRAKSKLHSMIMREFIDWSS